MLLGCVQRPHNGAALGSAKIHPSHSFLPCILLPYNYIPVSSPRMSHSIYPNISHRYEIRNTITSASRPLWDSPPGPRQLLPHYHAGGLWATDDICRLHNFRPRPVVEIIEREMWDAFILDGTSDSDLDLLEIRLHELYEVVDRIFIVESNRAY